MRNFKITIEYDGTNYAGWQCQKSKKNTIQEAIESVLQEMLQEKIQLIVSGRTDSGVHAQAQVANFKTNSNISLERLHEGLNALLPDDISIAQVKDVAPDFHSRFHPKSKTYRYTILNRKHRSALLRNRVYFCRYPLKLRLMQKEAKFLLGKHDFKAFAASGKKEKSSVRIIKNISVVKKNGLVYIDIEANGFLYNMVRNIVGTLIDIGRGKLCAGSLKKILLSRDRKLAGPTAAPCGLCLLKVQY